MVGLTNDTTRTFSGSLTEILSDLLLLQTVENLADEILSADARHEVARYSPSLHRPDAIYKQTHTLLYLLLTLTYGRWRLDISSVVGYLLPEAFDIFLAGENYKQLFYHLVLL